MRYATLWSLAIVLLATFKLPAAELTDLYQAQVPATGSAAQWQRAALSQVFVKLTGSEAVLSQPAIMAELKNSANYMKQFQNIQVEAQSLIQVHFDEQKITALLQRERIAMMGTRRPDQLIWLSQQMQQQPQFVLDNQHPVRKALLEQASQLGLSLVFPLYDVDDLAVLNEQALWTGDWTLIEQASARYSGTTAHNLLFDQFTDATGTVTFRLIAQYWQDGQMQSREYTNVDARQLGLQFSRDLAAQLAAKYAVNIDTLQTQGTELLLTVDAVNSLEHLVAVQKIFSSLLSVKSQTLTEFQQGRAVFKIALAASEDDFYRTIALVTQLKAQAQLDVAPTPELLAAEAQLDAQFEADLPINDAPTTPPAESTASPVNEAPVVEESTAVNGLSSPEASLQKTNHFIFVGH